MSRVKRGVTSHRRHKRLIKKVKGYQHPRTASIKRAREAWMKAGTNAYVSRKLKKREFRSLWITRLSAAVRPFEISYSRFIDGLFKADVQVDRKMMADLAVRFPKVFEKIIVLAKETLASGKVKI
jgi:large subunit ribosomal protein L20